MIEPSAHERPQRGLLQRMRICIPKSAQIRRPRAHFIDLCQGVDCAVHELRNAVRLGEAVQLDTLLECDNLGLVAVWGKDQGREAALVEPLDEQLPGVDVVFGEVGFVRGGFFEGASEHFVEDFGGGAEEFFVHCIELFFGTGVDAYDFGAELPGEKSMFGRERRGLRPYSVNVTVVAFACS